MTGRNCEHREESVDSRYVPLVLLEPECICLKEAVTLPRTLVLLSRSGTASQDLRGLRIVRAPNESHQSTALPQHCDSYCCRRFSSCLQPHNPQKVPGVE